MKVALDSSVLVAGLLPWHEHHEAARCSGAERLFTLNVRYFERVAPDGLEIVEAAT